MAEHITYDDKVSLTTSSLPRANKCTDADLNEIKEVVNENADELDEATADSGWIDIVPLSGSPGTGRYTPQYRKIGKQVFLRGYISQIGEEGTLVFTLPSGYRPTNRIRVLSIGDTLDTTMSICRILEDGRIFMFKTNNINGCLNLDCISFLID